MIDTLGLFLVAVGLWLVARSGVRTWRAQLQGQVRFQLARRVMVAANAVASEFWCVRFPQILPGESPVDLSAPPVDAKDALRRARAPTVESDARVAMFRNRWPMLQSAAANFLALRPEVRTLLSQDARQACDGFLVAPLELIRHFEAYTQALRMSGPSLDPVQREDLEGQRRGAIAALAAPTPGPEGPSPDDALGTEFVVAYLSGAEGRVPDGLGRNQLPPDTLGIREAVATSSVQQPTTRKRYQHLLRPESKR
jgi:hypothetical protein